MVPTVPAASSNAVGPSFEGSGEGGGFSPTDLRSAYKLPEAGGAGQTVAVIDAFDDPNANSDLKKYREHYGLPACTEATGCFKKVNQSGEAANYPEGDTGWGEEISLDLDMVSAACPECHILLVEASVNTRTDLYEAEDEAITLGATEVSNSWESSEYEGETSADKYFEHPGVPITVAAGDDGYGVSYPAASPHVISVGGTALKKAENSRGWTEEVWRNSELATGVHGAGTGSGCSAYETSKPVWQRDTGCAHRTDNDVAAVASAATPVSVYDSYGTGGWIDLGGTSVGAPFIAGIEAHASAEVRASGAKAFYEDFDGVFDVTTGNDGSCGGSYLCTAGAHYDSPTGDGAPDGVPSYLLANSGSTPTAVRDSGSKDQGVFYTDTANEIGVWGYSEATGWLNYSLASGVRAGTNPSAATNSATHGTIVFYVKGTGELAAWGYGGETWSPITLGGSVRSATSPTAVVDEGTGVYAAYYVNTSGEVAYWAYSEATGWVNGTLGGSVRAGTNLAATLDASTHEEIIYYINTSGELAAWAYTGGTFSNIAIGGTAKSGTSPAAAVGFNSTDVVVYYVNTSGEIALEYYQGSWKAGTLGGSVRSGSTPSVVNDLTTGDQYVDYVNSSNKVAYWALEGTWTSGVLGGTVAAGGSPTAIRDAASGDQWLYYFGENSDLWTWTAIEGSLSNAKVG